MFIIISTPERDRVHGKKHFGPPTNPFHIREWNTREFEEYLTESGIQIEKSLLVGEKWMGIKNFLRHLVYGRKFKRILVVVGKPANI